MTGLLDLADLIMALLVSWVSASEHCAAITVAASEGARWCREAGLL